MKEIYRDEFCRVLRYKRYIAEGKVDLTYLIVALDSDFLPPRWPTKEAMLRSHKAIEQVKYV